MDKRLIDKNTGKLILPANIAATFDNPKQLQKWIESMERDYEFKIDQIIVLYTLLRDFSNNSVYSVNAPKTKE